jgi:hypothetical protein
MVTVLTRFDGAFFIGQVFSADTQYRNRLDNPAIILYMPIQIQSRIGNQTGIAFQTNIVFLECSTIMLPPERTLTILSDDDSLTKHYLASLENFKRATVAPSEKKH